MLVLRDTSQLLILLSISLWMNVYLFSNVSVEGKAVCTKAHVFIPVVTDYPCQYQETSSIFDGLNFP